MRQRDSKITKEFRTYFVYFHTFSYKFVQSLTNSHRVWAACANMRLSLEGFFLSAEIRVFVDVNQLFLWFSHAL